MSDKKKHIPTTFIIIGAAAAVLIYCVWKMVPKVEEYKESRDTYEEIKKEAVTESSGYTDKESESGDSCNYIHIDWESLKDTDTVAWLVLDDISYPVMHTDDNETYLHHLPDGTYNYGGSIFLYADNDPYFTDENSILYGHNMADGSMFGKLKRYKDSQYKDHKFQLYLPDGTCHEYTFFSVLSVEKNDKVYTYSFADNDSFVKYQEDVKGRSLYQTGPDISGDNRLISLSTCNGYQGTSHRLIVQGCETNVVKTQEPASWYKEKQERHYSVYETHLMRRLRKLTGCSRKQSEKMLDIIEKSGLTGIHVVSMTAEATGRGFAVHAEGTDGNRYNIYIDSDNVVYAMSRTETNLPEFSDDTSVSGGSSEGNADMEETETWIYQE